VREFSLLRKVKVFTIYYMLNCYMFRSYDNLHVEIYLLCRNYSVDNGSFVFRIVVDITSLLLTVISTNILKTTVALSIE
jgi:hypothetical protein